MVRWQVKCSDLWWYTETREQHSSVRNHRHCEICIPCKWQPVSPCVHRDLRACSVCRQAVILCLLSHHTGDDMESLLFHFLDDWLFKFSADPFFVPRVRITACKLLFTVHSLETFPILCLKCHYVTVMQQRDIVFWIALILRVYMRTQHSSKLRLVFNPVLAPNSRFLWWRNKLLLVSVISYFFWS